MKCKYFVCHVTIFSSNIPLIFQWVFNIGIIFKSQKSYQANTEFSYTLGCQVPLGCHSTLLHLPQVTNQLLHVTIN